MSRTVLRRPAKGPVLPFLLVAGLALWLPTACLLADGLVVERVLPRSDAILVLSGSAEYLGRTEAAAYLFRQGAAPRVLLTNDGEQSGWDTQSQGNPHFADLAVRNLLRHGIPREAITVLPGRVTSTQDEAELLLAWIAGTGIEAVLLVTSDYHSRRTLWTFENESRRRGSGVRFGTSLGPGGERRTANCSWWLSPDGWRTVGVEYGKLFYYQVVYRV